VRATRLYVPWSRYPVDLGHNFVLAHSIAADAGRSRWPHRSIALVVIKAAES
jgi:hypothetical protein